jgi:hypothetical protein
MFVMPFAEADRVARRNAKLTDISARSTNCGSRSLNQILSWMSWERYQFGHPRFIMPDETRVKIYEWGKQTQSDDGLALARRFLDIRHAASECIERIDRIPSVADSDEQARLVIQLEVLLVNELADQIAKAAPLFARVATGPRLRRRSAPESG